MRRIAYFLHTDGLSLLTRRNYVVELRHLALWGFVTGGVEGTIASVVAAKTFAAPGLLTSVVFAIPIVVNVFNLAWGLLIRGHRRIRTYACLAAAALVMVGSIALTPAGRPWSAWVFAAQIAGTHFFLSGMLTLRTTMWRANYSRIYRAQVAGRLYMLNVMLSVFTTALLSVLFDRNPDYYRFVYPVAVLLGALSLLPLRRMRVRGERAERRRFRARAARGREGDGAASRVWSGVKEAAAILRDDRRFAGYMKAMFLLGSANFFTDPVLVNILARREGFSYYSSTFLMYQLPIVVLLISIRFWSKLFDHVGVLRFRVSNSLVWASSYTGLIVAMAMLELNGRGFYVAAIALLVVARVFNGMARGGGDLAWNIGHLHFATEHQTELYMGIHLGLTGLRGLTMPALGWLANHYLHWGSFVISLSLVLTSFVLFRRMAAAEREVVGPVFNRSDRFQTAATAIAPTTIGPATAGPALGGSTVPAGILPSGSVAPNPIKSGSGRTE
jgi:hypothetical protein